MEAPLPMVALPPHFSYEKQMRKLKLKFQAEELECFYITDPKEAEWYLSNMLDSSTKFWGIDLETAKAKGYEKHPMSGLDPRMSTIRLMQLYAGEKIYVFDLFKCRDAEVDFQIKKFLQEKKLIAHYAMFELKMLMHHFIEPKDMHCSMLLGNFVYHAEHSPFEPDPEDDDDAPKNVRSMSLAALTEKYFGIRIPKTYQLSNWNAPELSSSSLGFVLWPVAMTLSFPYLFLNAGTSSEPTCPQAPVTKIRFINISHLILKLVGTN